MIYYEQMKYYSETEFKHNFEKKTLVEVEKNGITKNLRKEDYSKLQTDKQKIHQYV